MEMPEMTGSFEETYPNIADWVKRDFGWIEIGRDHYSTSLVRVLDLGGMIWESRNREYETIDEALADAESAIAKWRKEQGI